MGGLLGSVVLGYGVSVWGCDCGKWTKFGQGLTDRFWELAERINEAFWGGNIFGRDIFIP